MRRCPQCQNSCLFDKLEAREKDEDRARELCVQLNDINGDGDVGVRETARDMISELEQLNKGLFIDGLRQFISYKKNELGL
jgi:hypothetical protein